MTTYQLLGQLHQARGWDARGRLDWLAQQVLGTGLAAFEQDAALVARLSTLMHGLRVFRDGTAQKLMLYGAAFIEQLCHAIFGSDPGLLVYGGRPARRVLILGETGAGKERIAEVVGATLLAMESSAAKFHAVNAAAFSPGLVDSELFGHTRAAFTGADAAREGLFSQAGAGGVIFFDEIGEASPEVQARLLRVIQLGEYRAVGASKSEHARFHVIGATNRPEVAMRSGDGIRSDLFFRLARSCVRVPAFRTLLTDASGSRNIFRQLVDDVFRQRICEGSADDRGMHWFDQWSKRLADTLAEQTSGYSWPGNLRECTNLIEEAIYLGPDAVSELCARLERSELAHSQGEQAQHDCSPLKQRLASAERGWYAAAAAQAATIDQVAKALGVSRQTASRRLRHFGLHFDR